LSPAGRSGDRSSRSRAPRLRDLTLVVATLIGSSLLAAGAAIANGEGRAVVAWWPLTALLAGLAILAGWALARRRARWPATLLAAGAGGVAAATLLRSALSLAQPERWALASDRVALFAGNPNLLATLLVVAGTGSLLTAKRRVVRWTVTALVVLAVIATGSRTAMVALAGGLTAWWATGLRTERRPARSLRWKLAAALLLLTVLLALQTPPRNLLIDPNAFDGAAWQRLAAEMNVLATDLPAPDGSRSAWALRLVPDRDGPFPGILLTQSVGPGREGVPYVASIFARAAADVPLAIGNGLAVESCAVGPEWTRCVTPPSPGDGQRSMQLQIRSTRVDEPLQVDVWGAQLEIGTSATDLDLAGVRMSPLPVHRFRILDWRTASALRSRLATFERVAGWAASSPWTGLGRTELAERFEASRATPRDPVHAHNLPLQVAAEAGLLGLLALLLPILVLVRVRPSRSVLVLLVALALLNLADQTYFYTPAFVVVWFTFGVLLGRERGTVAT
jgi:O-antigen ligase